MELATEFVIYQQPGSDGWADRGRPALAWEHEALREQAETALARRREAYPQMIARGQITAEDAQADIEAWELIAAEWRWICTGEGDLPHPLTLRVRIAAVDLAMERVTAELERGRRSAEVIRQAHLVEALRWHLACLKFDAPAVHFWAGLTRQCRADAAARATSPTAPPASPPAGKEAA